MKTTIRMIVIALASLILVSCMGGGQLALGPAVIIGYNGVDQREQGGPPNGGLYEQQPQQQSQQDPRQTVGTVFSDDCFQNHPINPTPGCVRILWVKAYGPQCRLWLNDIGGDSRGRGRAQLQVVPEGQWVLFDKVTKKAWKPDCGNRVTVAMPPQPRPQPHPMVAPPAQQHYRPQPVVKARYCPPPTCPQPRQVIRRKCPPPPCPPGQRPQQRRY